MMWFHLMPYPALPEDFNRKHHSVWVDIDPGLFDREIMAETYRTYIDQLIYAEECGFDGICVNEHHNNGYGLMPSPNLIASILASRTSRAAITVLGNSVALYNPPRAWPRVRHARPVLPRPAHRRLPGGHADGHRTPYSVSPSQLRPKYYGGHRPHHEGVAGHRAALLQRPVQPVPLRQPGAPPPAAPHPPVWIPGGGSVETWDFCAENATSSTAR